MDAQEFIQEQGQQVFLKFNKCLKMSADQLNLTLQNDFFINDLVL